MNLRIKRKYLLQIVAGTRRIEYRDATHFYLSRLCVSGEPRADLKSIRFYILQEFVEVEVLKIHFDETRENLRIHLGRVIETNVHS